MIEDFVARFYSSRHPIVRRVRAFLLSHEQIFLLIKLPFRARRFVRAFLLRLRARIWPPIDRKTLAILDARHLGGALSVADMERVWSTGLSTRRALCIAEALEAEQVRVILSRAGLRTVDRFVLNEHFNDWPEPNGYDLVVVVDGKADADGPRVASFAAFLDRCASAKTLLHLEVNLSNRAAHAGDGHKGAKGSTSCGGRLQDKLSAGLPIRVVLLNDVGFQYGAGNALKRQAASFLLNGWDVTVVAWKPDIDDARPSVVGPNGEGTWGGIHSLGLAHVSRDLSEGEVADLVFNKVRSFDPDLVVVGNIHGADWPLAILDRLRVSGVRVIAYMHDCYFVTGRCAYPGNCELFKIGCDASCPTSHEYPCLSPDKIAPAWLERKALFSGRNAIPLVANSRWTRDLVTRRFGDEARSAVIHLGLDHNLFAPVSRAAARRLLGLPQDMVIVLMGAVDVRSPFKGGPLFRDVHAALAARDDLGVVLFGKASERLRSTKAFGLVGDERLMPLIMAAADIFVTTATMEAFGQTILEAAACGLPTVAFDVGGISDIVVDGTTGILVGELDASKLLAAVETLVRDAGLRQRLGAAGRSRIEGQFTLQHQGRAWIDWLGTLC